MVDFRVKSNAGGAETVTLRVEHTIIMINMIIYD